MLHVEAEDSLLLQVEKGINVAGVGGGFLAVKVQDLE
jgi:hypothetical protein